MSVFISGSSILLYPALSYSIPVVTSVFIQRHLWVLWCHGTVTTGHDVALPNFSSEQP